jgi:hypothetical protein
MNVPASAPSRDNWARFPRRVLTFALCVDALLLVLHACVSLMPISSASRPLTFLFGLNGEGNVPAWYSGTQLLLVGLVFFLLSSWFFQSDERIAPLRRLLTVSGIVFTYLSADEVGQIHERMSALVQSWHWLRMVEYKTLIALGRKAGRIHGGGAWIPIFIVAGIALLWWLWPQIKVALRHWRTEFVLIGVGLGMLVFGAVFIEMLGAAIPKGALLLRDIEVGIEETFEITGVSVILYGVLRVLAAAGSRLLPGPASTAEASAPEATESSPGAQPIGSVSPAE